MRVTYYFKNHGSNTRKDRSSACEKGESLQQAGAHGIRVQELISYCGPGRGSVGLWHHAHTNY